MTQGTFMLKQLSKDWLSSKDIKKQLKLSGCELMHLRERGELEYKRVGNAFFYKQPKQFSKSNDHQ